MANEPINTAEELTDEQLSYVYQNRRYVGVKETVGFVLWDAAQSFNINSFSNRFVNNIFELPLSLSALASTINAPWDMINDVLFAAVVDKTRTRWGKFRPYLLALAIPGLIGTLAYWYQPLFLLKANKWIKFGFYLFLAMLRDGIGTFQDISRTGLMSTITPHPVDRIRLVTLANWASGQFGEKLPEQLFTAWLDLVDNRRHDANRSKTLINSFVGMGTFTTLVSSGMSFWFFMNSQERILQSVKPPSLKLGLESIVKNKPMLLLTLSDMLNSFGIGGGKTNYYTDVLHFNSLTMIAGIPAAPISPLSFALVPYFRRKFSSRTLYLIGSYSDKLLMIPVFLFGCIGMNWKTKAGGLYQKVLPMGIAMAIEEFVWTFFYGTGKVVNTEMYNECMDYCEWKCGYRTEAMTGVAKGLARKLAGSVANIVNTMLMQIFNYDQSAYKQGKEQPDSVKFFLFAYFAIVPTITGSFGLIPMLFYDLSGEKRERMYAELLVRRAEVSSVASTGSTDDLNRIADEQLHVVDQ